MFQLTRLLVLASRDASECYIHSLNTLICLTDEKSPRPLLCAYASVPEIPSGVSSSTQTTLPRHPSRTENQSKTNLESISHTGTSASQTDFTLTQTRTRSHCNARPTYTQHTLMKLIHTHTLNPLRDRFSCTGARVRYQAQ